MKTTARKRIAQALLALAIISLILIQAYIESSLGFTPNH
jgi:hypothetical protein